VRDHVAAAAAFLDWLTARGLTLAACTQADLDQRLAGTSGHLVPWLFPGRKPGSALTEDALAQRLHALGISPRQGRSTALFTPGRRGPAAILANTLGIHVQAAIQWQKISGGDWTAYAADISRRGHAQERARQEISTRTRCPVPRGHAPDVPRPPDSG